MTKQVRPRLSPEEYDWLQRNKEREGVLFIGDLHEPFTRDGYLSFCKEMYDKYMLKDVVFSGDVLDNHASSYHESDADGMSAGDELEFAKARIAKWYETFPSAKVCYGNHDIMSTRKAQTSGLSKNWVKSVPEMLETPNWDFADSFIIDNVLYCHGIGRKARQRSRQDMMSVAQGHYHSESYVEWTVGKRDKVFALQVGCGMDDSSYAAAYGKHFQKMHINVGIIKDSGSVAFLEYMDI